MYLRRFQSLIAWLISEYQIEVLWFVLRSKLWNGRALSSQALFRDDLWWTGHQRYIFFSCSPLSIRTVILIIEDTWLVFKASDYHQLRGVKLCRKSSNFVSKSLVWDQVQINQSCRSISCSVVLIEMLVMCVKLFLLPSKTRPLWELWQQLLF